MKEGGRGTSSGGRHKVRGALVVTEVALAFVLLTGAGLLIRSFFQMQQVDTGFDSTNVLTAGLPIPDKRFPDPAQLNAYLRQVVSNVEALPGVRDVALTSALPMQGWGYGMPFQRADKPMVDRANRRACFFKMVSPSYFRALGMKLRKGRPLGDHDAKGAPPVTVINETMARLYFKDEEPMGKRILVQEIVPGKTQLGPEIPWEIVGVVADEKVDNLDSRGDNPGMYVSNDQSPVFFQALVVRTAMDPAGPDAGARQGRTRNQQRPDAHRGEDAGADQGGIDGLQPLALHAAHGVCRDGRPARGHRHLWRDFVFGGAAYA